MKPRVIVAITTRADIDQPKIREALLAPWFSEYSTLCPEKVDYKEPIRGIVTGPESFGQHWCRSQYWTRKRNPKGSGSTFPKCKYPQSYWHVEYDKTQGVQRVAELLPIWFAAMQGEFGYFHLITEPEQKPHMFGSARDNFLSGGRICLLDGQLQISDLGWRTAFSHQLAGQLGISKLSDEFEVRSLPECVSLDLVEGIESLSLDYPRMIARRQRARERIGEQFFMKP
jgi:hypothetical protein